MGDGVCFSGPALLLLGSIWAVLQGAFVALFWKLLQAKDDSIREARAERDRMADGWEATVGLGEQVVRRERRKP
jgi:hypothetical protein